MNAFNDFRREVMLMSEIEHLNLVKMIGITVDPFRLILEFMDSGNLFQFVHDKKNKLSAKKMVSFAVNIAHGMSFLHGFTPKLIHRDLKSPNVKKENFLIF